MKDREQFKNLSKTYTCNNCKNITPASMHCGHPMHLAGEGNNTEWNCWMGPSCRKKVYERCCEDPSLVAN